MVSLVRKYSRMVHGFRFMTLLFVCIVVVTCINALVKRMPAENEKTKNIKVSGISM